jgi:hypothetical protein
LIGRLRRMWKASKLRKANQRFHAAISKVRGQAEGKRKAEQMKQDKENQKQKKRVKLTKYIVCN